VIVGKFLKVLCLFAIKGANDGHQFINKTIELGAATVIVCEIYLVL